MVPNTNEKIQLMIRVKPTISAAMVPKLLPLDEPPPVVPSVS